MCFSVFSLLTNRFDWIVRASEFGTNDLNYIPRLSIFIVKTKDINIEYTTYGNIK